MNEEKKSAGNVFIHTDVIARYAAVEAMSCFGIVGLCALSVKDGFARILKNEKLTRGVNLSIADGKITVDFHIIVAYGVNIPALCDNLSENVTYHLETFTGLKVEKINIFVEGVRVID